MKDKAAFVVFCMQILFPAKSSLTFYPSRNGSVSSFLWIEFSVELWLNHSWMRLVSLSGSAHCREFCEILLAHKGWYLLPQSQEILGTPHKMAGLGSRFPRWYSSPWVSPAVFSSNSHNSLENQVLKERGNQDSERLCYDTKSES